MERIAAIEDVRIRAYVPLPNIDHRTPFFGKGQFACDACSCLGGAVLLPLKHKHAETPRTYPAPATACNACPLKSSCTTSHRGR